MNGKEFSVRVEEHITCREGRDDRQRRSPSWGLVIEAGFHECLETK